MSATARQSGGQELLCAELPANAPQVHGLRAGAANPRPGAVFDVHIADSLQLDRKEIHRLFRSKQLFVRAAHRPPVIMVDCSRPDRDVRKLRAALRLAPRITRRTTKSFRAVHRLDVQGAGAGDRVREV